MSDPSKPHSFSFLKLAGPGLVVAATGIGSGDVVSATVGGARYGVVLLWAIVAGAFFKFVLSEGIARWQLATGKTALEGWADHLPGWVKWYFGAYLLIWTVAVSAALTLHDPAPAVQGLLIPIIPAGSGTYVLSLIGGVGGSITMLSYNYWMREEKMRGAGFLGYVRGDIAVAYIFTALFGISIMLIASDAFFVAGVTLKDAEAVPKMAAALGALLGNFGRFAFSAGFWAAVFASLLGVWQSVPYLYADFYGILKKLPAAERLAVVKVTSTPYRLALAYITLVPIPFAFTGRPIQIVIIYTIVGSLFVPFLAATLLYLNNKVKWTEPVPHNAWYTNLLLAAILLLFAIVGSQEAIGAWRQAFGG